MKQEVYFRHLYLSISLSSHHLKEIPKRLSDKMLPETFENGHICQILLNLPQGGLETDNYRLGPVNSKWFVGKLFLWIKRKFELNYNL